MTIKRIWKEIKTLPAGALFDLLQVYDSYVKEICDKEDGSIPVCVAEFFTNDYKC